MAMWQATFEVKGQNKTTSKILSDHNRYSGLYLTAGTNFFNIGKYYRAEQPNWECTMWKFQDFSATQILRESNFGHFDAQKLPFWPFEQL